MSASGRWQVYDETGQPVKGHGEVADKFAEDTSLLMANSHLWLWRDQNTQRQILLQTRARHLPRKPGYLHASASGHVNLGESAKEAVIREANEELGVDLQPDTIRELFVLRGGARKESFNYVFSCRFDDSSRLLINKSEVERVDWVSLEEFVEMVRTPDKFKLIDLGSEYFEKLFALLKKL